MFRKPTGTILCPSCGRLTRADAAECLICGRRRPGMWGLTHLFRHIFRTGSPTQVITVTCGVLYVVALLADPLAILQPRGPLSVLSPSGGALLKLGAAGAIPWHLGHWWTVLTAIYLHGGLLHILFNALWIRQLGPAVEELYGPARFVVIFTVSGVAGFVLSTFVGLELTVGASGSIFGLFGALVAFGQKRGGTFGVMVLREYGLFALILFIYGLLPHTGVDNWAHGGGFVGGLTSGFALSLAEHRSETSLDHLLAGACVVLTIAAFGLSLWTALSWS